MMRSANSPVFHLLAPGRTEVQGLKEEIALHLEVAPGHDVVERRHAPEERNVLKCTGDSLGRRVVGAHPPAGHPLEGDGAVLGVVEAVDDVEHGALAGAVRPDDCPHLSL